jgi:5-methylcytosine-specific restriction protein A
MSTVRKTPGGWIRKTKERGPNGRGICRWCKQEVPLRRRTFCNDHCVHEWRLRTNPGYLRLQVLKRDRGVCAVCGLDTLEFYRRLQRVPARKRKALSRKLDLHARRRSFWDADHILPVAEGGGECDLSNIRTLCLWCHEKHTAALRQRIPIHAGRKPIRNSS